MSIQYAMLGFLSWMPFSGYDLKKRFEESAIFPWSGNNNQIYKALVELHNAGLVTVEVDQQGDYPPRKIYTITAEGQAALRGWILSQPELPQVRNTFLVQLAWADQLDAAELDGLLRRYEEEMHVQARMFRQHQQRKASAPDRTRREALLWGAIFENRALMYETELHWVRGLRKELASLQSESD